MCSFIFTIPFDRTELLNRPAAEYNITYPVSFKELEKKFKECKRDINESGSMYVLEDFPTLYGILDSLNKLKFDFLHSIFDTFVQPSLSLLGAHLDERMPLENLDIDDRQKLSNVVRMNLYFAIEFILGFQDRLNDKYKDIEREKGKRNVQGDQHKSEYNWDWKQKEKSVLILIKDILGKNIMPLWGNGLPDDFVSEISKCCYGLIEKQTAIYTLEKETLTVISDIIVNLIKNYSHTNSCVERFIQLARYKDKDGIRTQLAHITVKMINKHGLKTLINQIIKKITEIGSDDSIDHNQMKPLSKFLAEIAKQDPKIMLLCVSDFMDNLYSQAFCMRSCVLTVMKELFIGVLYSEELSDEDRELRDMFLTHLFNHISDANVLVRSNCLKLWSEIISSRGVPNQFFNELTSRVASRLTESNAFVLRNAIGLMRLLLINNPFSAKLDKEKTKKRLSALTKELKNVIKNEDNANKLLEGTEFYPDLMEFIDEEIRRGNLNDIPDLSTLRIRDIVAKIPLVRKLLIERKFKEAILNARIIATCLNEYQSNGCTREGKEYYAQVLKQIWTNSNSLPHEDNVLKLYLNMGNRDELYKDLEDNDQKEEQLKLQIFYNKETLKFIETIDHAVPSVVSIFSGDSIIVINEGIEFFSCAKKMDVWIADEGLRAMLRCMQKCGDAGVEKKIIDAYHELYFKDGRNKVIIQKLMELVKGSSKYEQNAIRVMMTKWTNERKITPSIIMDLFEMMMRRKKAATIQEARGASLLLSLIASADSRQIVEANLDIFRLTIIRGDSEIITYISEMLIMLSNTKLERGVYVKLDRNHEIFQALAKYVIMNFSKIEVGNYYAASMAAIHAISKLSKSPRELFIVLFNDLRNQLVEEKHIDDCTKNDLLARYIMIVGRCVSMFFKYLENDMLNEMKRKNAINLGMELCLIEEDESKKAKKGKKAKKEKSYEEMEREDMLMAADEKSLETILDLTRNRLLNVNTYFGDFSKMVVEVCRNPNSYTDHARLAACVTLTTLMAISPEICEQHIQLFVTMIERSRDWKVKINLCVGFSDLTFRFPNVLDPWLPHLYKRLKDESINVRFNSLTMISHLLSTGMIKVEGNVTALSVCLVDKDEKIKALAEGVFKDLSESGCTLYNTLPIIISHLVSVEKDINEGEFQTVISLLMNLIKKEKQFEVLSDKICHRIKGTMDERQCSWLAFCLTTIPGSEKLLKKIIENIACFNLKLNFGSVRSSLDKVLLNCKKHQRQFKAPHLVAEFESVIEKLALRDKINDIRPKKSVAGTAGKSRVTNNQHVSKYARGDATSTTEADSDVSDFAVPTPGRATKGRAKRNPVRNDTDRASSPDDSAAPQTRRKMVHKPKNA